MNIFQASYEARLAEWYELRKHLQSLSDLDKCIQIDKWWQQAPLITHYLHPLDVKSWPNPWDLLVDNTYCTLARGLGMCYTLLMAGVSDIRFVLAKNDFGEEVFILIVNDSFVLNYWPNMVQEAKKTDFTVVTEIDIFPVYRFLK